MPAKSYLADNQRDISDRTVNRRMDRAIRIAWVLLALLTLSILLMAVKPRIVELQADPYGFGAAYERLGISSDFFAIYFTSIESLFALLFFTVGGLIFWKASRDRMAILVSAAFITMGTATPLPEALIVSDPGWRWPVLLLRVSGIGLMFLFLYLFPDGRFVPRWNRWLVVVAALYLASWFIFPMLIPSIAILAEATDAAAARPYVPLALLTLLGIGGSTEKTQITSMSQVFLSSNFTTLRELFSADPLVGKYSGITMYPTPFSASRRNGCLRVL